MLSAEHATVLDEIDLLRGKLSQLERNVLTAAAMAMKASSNGAASGGSTAGQQQGAAVTGATTTPSSTAAVASAMIDIQSLLSSLGLGGDAVADLPAVGDGPLGGITGEMDVGQEWSNSTDLGSR